MTRAKLLAVLVAATASTAAHAAYDSFPSPFAVAPISSSELAKVNGMGDDKNYAGNFRTMVTERARVDERVFASANNVAMDAWWAYVGSELIAANLTANLR